VKEFQLDFRISGKTTPRVGYLLLGAMAKGDKECESPAGLVSPKSRDLAIAATAPDDVEGTFLWVTLLLGVTSIVLAFLMHLGDLGKRLGKPQWTFSSWATNVNIAAGLLTGLATASALVDNPALFTKASYVSIAALLMMLIGAAPAVYSLIRPPASDQGFVFSFEVAALMTLYGVQGQLLLVIFMIRELQLAAILVPAIATVFQVAVGMVSVAVIVYGNTSVHGVIKNQPTDRRDAIGAKWKLL
jgi:hypothetical protein